MDSTPLLECRKIAFERDDFPLFSGVALSLEGGQALQVRGANGVGKTTLLRILATAISPSAGEILWQGRPLAGNLRNYRADIIYIGHSPAVKPDLNPLENLRWYFNLFPATPGNPGAAPGSPEGALEKLGLGDFTDVPCHTLSAGQLRRVALARLYLARARLWILDEPFTAIDISGVADLEALMAEHLDSGGAILTTSHQKLTLEGLSYLDLETYAH